MSSRTQRDHLNDILQAASDIEEFTAGMTFEEYAGNKAIRFAVERALLILSEAAYRLGSDAESVSANQDWRSLRGVGNFIRHHYHRVDDAVIWKAIHTDLQDLKQSCKSALQSIDG